MKLVIKMKLASVFPIVGLPYGAETWTLKKLTGRKLLHLRCGAGTSGEGVLDGEKKQCMGFRKHQAGMDTGIEGSFDVFWTCGETGTGNGE